MNVSIKVLLFSVIFLSVFGCKVTITNEQKESENENIVSESLTINEINDDDIKLVSLVYDTLIHGSTSCSPDDDDCRPQGFSHPTKSCFELFVNQDDLNNFKRKMTTGTFVKQLVGQPCPRYLDGGWYSIKKYKNSLRSFLEPEDISELLRNGDHRQVQLKTSYLYKDFKSYEYYYVRNYDKRDDPFFLKSFEYLDIKDYDPSILDNPLSLIIELKGGDGETTSVTCLDLSFTGRSYEENQALINQHILLHENGDSDYRIVKMNQRCQESYFIPDAQGRNQKYKAYVLCGQLDNNTQSLKVFYAFNDITQKIDPENPERLIDKTNQELETEFNCLSENDVSDGSARKLRKTYYADENYNIILNVFSHQRISE